MDGHAMRASGQLRVRRMFSLRQVRGTEAIRRWVECVLDTADASSAEADEG